MKKFLVAVAMVTLCACSTVPPAKIGKDTYVGSKTNMASAFISDAKTMVALLGESAEFCSSMGREFLLVTSEQTTSSSWQKGTANITFRCLSNDDPEYQHRPTIRKDNGVNTVEVITK